jgi:hypothetical protein
MATSCRQAYHRPSDHPNPAFPLVLAGSLEIKRRWSSVLALNGEASQSELGHAAKIAAVRTGSISATIGLREIDPDELPDWDARVLESPGGDVHQTKLWAMHWSKAGWRPRYLIFDDGLPLLSLERPWPLVGGGGAYLPRGPIAAGDAPFRTTVRLAEAYDYLVGRGVDVVASDAAIPSETGYRDLIESVGFRPIEEIEPSRHRLSLPLPAGTTEADLWHSISASSRQRAGSAERRGLLVVRYDTWAPTGSSDGFERPSVQASEPAAFRLAMERFYDLLHDTAVRRGFLLAPRTRIVDWTSSDITAGMATYLEVLAPDGRLLGGALFYRQGGRYARMHTHPTAMICAMSIPVSSICSSGEASSSRFARVSPNSILQAPTLSVIVPDREQAGQCSASSRSSGRSGGSG